MPPPYCCRPNASLDRNRVEPLASEGPNDLTEDLLAATISRGALCIHGTETERRARDLKYVLTRVHDDGHIRCHPRNSFNCGFATVTSTS